ncbi:MAG TPA: flagellar biosynthetic protein FliQ [Anaerohalosphaeraceae bacterium]|nr:flagellar biosynthetic protein FliQ [Phycisphaerae bacterium]HOK94927.1 flagellar biosynthetic protein FliQ [Anaerohalosphaeraceae bacterium]HOL30767.1 flagellar biosynthetic protein FliQ [Anaerohalosphaeraceae bacterium]HOM75418.1 flagellar biosynthetic protein FliQ [Anaerohalosphaeraceae bacterium]HPC63022.1 flagellar biosynthetic protein FliQ [Anaerohalosphaeraceae bacterium]
MDENAVIFLGKQTLETALFVSAPVLITCIAVGVVITLFQAVTSIRDMSLTVVPKLIAVGIVILLSGHWALERMIRFTSDIFGYIQQIGR